MVFIKVLLWMFGCPPRRGDGRSGQVRQTLGKVHTRCLRAAALWRFAVASFALPPAAVTIVTAIASGARFRQ